MILIKQISGLQRRADSQCKAQCIWVSGFMFSTEYVKIYPGIFKEAALLVIFWLLKLTFAVFLCFDYGETFSFFRFSRREAVPCGGRCASSRGMVLRLRWAKHRLGSLSTMQMPTLTSSWNADVGY